MNKNIRKKRENIVNMGRGVAIDYQIRQKVSWPILQNICGGQTKVIMGDSDVVRKSQDGKVSKISC